MPALVLSFLGGFQVLLNRQPITRFRSANNQGLLVYLACNRDKPISRETLATLFWPEAPEKEARHNLRQALYRLRKLLDGGAEPYLLVTRQTVQFNAVADYELDVEQFTCAIDANALGQAVDHYAGDLLPGFSCSSDRFEVWLRNQREHLHQLALEAMLQLAEDSLASNDFSTTVAMAQRQLVLEPWREPAHRQLMHAYARMGDRSNALTQFERCREQLWDEIGIEPASETAALVDDIRSSRVGVASAENPITPPAKPKHNLPADTTPFIGRKRESAEITALFTQAQQRLVTIVAPGGMGKTRLGIEVGRRLLPAFEDGVTFVDLAAVTDPAEIAGVIAAAIHYQAPDTTQSLLPQLLNALAQRNMLLILDNFEQLLAGVTLIDQILKACPELSLLVTSRQPLNLVSGSRYRLQGLDFPDLLTVDDALAWSAVALFVDSGRRARPGYALSDDNLVYVLQICRLVQGMPLALILAAAWFELLGSAEIAIEIEKSLAFLSSDLADLPHRQRSMHAVFDRSWHHLQPDEQIVLAKLSVFRGGFTRDAAEHVAGANLRILLSLVNKSFLQRRSDGGRYVMHELLRQYAAEQRRHLGVSEDAQYAHCRYFAQIVPREMRRVLYFLPLLLPRDYAADRDNFQHAWEYALHNKLPNNLADLATGMIKFMDSQGIQPTATIDAAVALVPQIGTPSTDPAALNLKAAQLRARQMVTAAPEVNRQYISLIEESSQGEQYELCYWLCIQLAMQWRMVNDPSLIDWLDVAQTMAEKLADETLVKMVIGIRVWGYLAAGRPVAAAEAQLVALLPYFESRYPDSFILYGVLSSLSMVCDDEGRLAEAVKYGKRAINLAVRWGDLFWISSANEKLVLLYKRVGQFDLARSHLSDIVNWHVALGQNWQMLGCLGGAACMHPQLLGGDTAAVAILSMLTHHPEFTENNHHIIQNHLANVRKMMAPEAFSTGWETGKQLEIDAVVEQLSPLT
ncbi:MAG: AAA family ATPase [Anaerolineae bacterium]|nr:AAA family ATPase [Anaerolineae bacterium]